MTEKTWVKKFSHIPWDLEECCFSITQELHDCELKDFAIDYIAAKDNILQKLQEINYEFG